MRKQGYSAENAARAAIRPQKKSVVDWDNDSATVEIGSYTIELKKEIDPYPDLSWLGEYSNQPGPSAITRVNATSNQYRYWNPAISLDEEFQSWHRLGYSKVDAWLKALEWRDFTYNRMESYNRGDWVMMGITATARLGTMHCGESSLWGIESDSGDYLNEMAPELAQSAANEATANRDNMIRTRAEEIAALASIQPQII